MNILKSFVQVGLFACVDYYLHQFYSTMIKIMLTNFNNV